MGEIASRLEGQLTGSIYSHGGGRDDAAYAAIEPFLRRRVGRLLNDRMPTGVAVSPAMNHGGPYPATTDPETVLAVAELVRDAIRKVVLKSPAAGPVVGARRPASSRRRGEPDGVYGHAGGRLAPLKQAWNTRKSSRSTSPFQSRPASAQSNEIGTRLGPLKQAWKCRKSTRSTSPSPSRSANTGGESVNSSRSSPSSSGSWRSPTPPASICPPSGFGWIRGNCHQC